jgi:hypothetical protein
MLPVAADPGQPPLPIVPTQRSDEAIAQRLTCHGPTPESFTTFLRAGSDSAQSRCRCWQG